MQCVVKIGSLKLEAATKEECKEMVGKKVCRVSGYTFMDKTKKILFEVSWSNNGDSHQALLNVYYFFDMDEVDACHCNVCKDVHKLFYCNPNYNCGECKYAAYKQRVQQKERDMRVAGREVLRKT